MTRDGVERASNRCSAITFSGRTAHRLFRRRAHALKLGTCSDDESGPAVVALGCVGRQKVAGRQCKRQSPSTQLPRVFSRSSPHRIQVQHSAISSLQLPSPYPLSAASTCSANNAPWSRCIEFYCLLQRCPSSLAAQQSSSSTARSAPLPAISYDPFGHVVPRFSGDAVVNLAESSSPSRHFH